MSDSDQSQILLPSEARRAEIADLWYRAVMPTGFSPHPAATARVQFRVLTDQAIAVVVGEHSAWGTAEDVGAAVVRLGYDQPQALGATLEILARELMSDLTPSQATALQPRLSAALGAMASGFAAQSRATILTEQEEIRGALLVARQQAEERLRHEEQLRAREQATRATAEAERDHLQQILDVLPEGILIVDDTGHFVLSNRAAVAIIGRDLAGLAVPMIDQTASTRHVLRRLDGATLSLEELPMERAFLQGTETRGEQFLVHNAASGRDVPVLVTSAPLHDRDQRLVGVVAVFQDITALKDLERTRDLFLSAVSHDLKSPLTSIQGLTQLLHHQIAQEGTPRSARWVKSLDTMLRSVRSMTRLLDELRDVTRLQLGRPLDLDLSSTDLTALV
jgi:PAS domain S-box-containing protein